MSARTENGWLVVDCDAPDAAEVGIALGHPRDFIPAFRDYSDGKRVAKIRLPDKPGRVRVYLRAAGVLHDAGIVSI